MQTSTQLAKQEFTNILKDNFLLSISELIRIQHEPWKKSEGIDIHVTGEEVTDINYKIAKLQEEFYLQAEDIAKKHNLSLTIHFHNNKAQLNRIYEKHRVLAQERIPDWGRNTYEGDHRYDCESAIIIFSQK